jgi:hypothetical protein
MKFIVQYETQFHLWKNYVTYNGRNSAYRTAQIRAREQKCRLRIVDENNALLDILYQGVPCFIHRSPSACRR